MILNIFDDLYCVKESSFDGIAIDYFIFEQFKFRQLKKLDDDVLYHTEILKQFRKECCLFFGIPE